MQSEFTAAEFIRSRMFPLLDLVNRALTERNRWLGTFSKRALVECGEALCLGTELGYFDATVVSTALPLIVPREDIGRPEAPERKLNNTARAELLSKGYVDEALNMVTLPSTLDRQQAHAVFQSTLLALRPIQMDPVVSSLGSLMKLLPDSAWTANSIELAVAEPVGEYGAGEGGFEVAIPWPVDQVGQVVWRLRELLDWFLDLTGFESMKPESWILDRLSPERRASGLILQAAARASHWRLDTSDHVVSARWNAAVRGMQGAQEEVSAYLSRNAPPLADALHASLQRDFVLEARRAIAGWDWLSAPETRGHPEPEVLRDAGSY